MGNFGHSAVLPKKSRQRVTGLELGTLSWPLFVFKKGRMLSLLRGFSGDVCLTLSRQALAHWRTFHLPVCLSVCMYVCLVGVCLFICLAVCLSVFMSVHY